MEPAPTDRGTVLSPEWLTSALQGAYPGAAISGFRQLDEVTTLATKMRLELEYADGPADAPRSVFLKAFFDDQPAPPWIGEPEARFFSELAPMLDLRMPRAIYAAIDPSNQHGIVIQHDMVAEGATFLNALTPYSADQVAATLGELAKLHAQSWDSPKLEDVWLQPEVWKFIEYRTKEDLERLLAEDARAGRLPDAIRDATRLRNGVIAVFAATEDARRSLVHGDAHAGNLYLDAEGNPGICDWQIVRRGHWSFDVGYHLASALVVEDRERAEVDLVRDYLDRMRGYGVEMPPWDDAWRAYQRAIVYGYNLWVVTTTVDPRITNELVYRLGTAVAAHDSMELLGV